MTLKKNILRVDNKLVDFLYRHISKLKRWADIEKELSPEEKSIEKKFFFFVFVFGFFVFSSASASSYLRSEGFSTCDEGENERECTRIGGAGFWPKPEFSFENTDSGYTLAEDGFFAKASVPTTDGVDRSGISTVTRYEVQPGDSLDLIASKFNITIKTITDNNVIKNTDVLETGDILKILPVDGYLYVVKRGDTVSQISKKFGLDQEVFIKQNKLDVRGLKSGFSVILPGKTKPAYVAPVVTKPRYVASRRSGSKKAYNGNQSGGSATYNYTAPRSGKRFSWPVVGGGTLTQGFHYGHYAIDIWGPNQPGIKSIGAGTVIRAAYNCAPRSYGCQGGYGNLVVIDHGNGYKGLYAHNSKVYVKVGDKVKTGQIIAKMGNSGNTRGRTGIHLHFELTYNGRKINPIYSL
ncbi:TPA: M23 family metallopeptidase [Candidatus Gracilibacteria bacterium]|nr:M23 family metallopeptidase [Candidatus Gracilibacteria bacterium]HIQ57494.1 M23 family metallopeptidase [Candidatus Gracilibacteria bacterium]